MVYVPKNTGRRALEELDQVAWSVLKHAYSGGDDDFSDYALPMDDIPAILRAFFDEDEEMRMMAHFDGIISSVWHQGTIYSVTPTVVPFLAAFAADSETPVRGYILGGLVLIAQSALKFREDGDPLGEETLQALHASHSFLRIAGESDSEYTQDAVSWLLDPSGLEEDEVLELYSALEEWGDAENGD